MSRGTRAQLPESPDFVECYFCRKARRIGRAVSRCVKCEQALCTRHLDACGCWPANAAHPVAP